MVNISGKKILIGISGGISAYKVAIVVSSLAKVGAQVRVILTQGAEQFITPLTFATLSRSPAYTDRDFWQATHGKPLHITLAEWAEVILIAPLSANTLGKIVHGIADNLLLNVLLASTCPVVVAPAMNTSMWQNPAVQGNWQAILTDERWHPIPPAEGLLACDAVGTGKMAEPDTIQAWLASILWTGGKRNLQGKTVLVSAGGTREFIDPVRFIGNPATGKQGTAIALSALHRGAQVILVLANGEAPPTHPSLQTIRVSTSGEMQAVMAQEFPRADITVMNSAVGDVQPATTSSDKLPKGELPHQLPLVPVPDILKILSDRKKNHQLLIGFAAQTGTTAEVIALAQAKLKEKRLDAIVANPINSPTTGFASDHNQAILIDHHRQETTPLVPKLELAHRLWDFALGLYFGTEQNAKHPATL